MKRATITCLLLAGLSQGCTALTSSNVLGNNGAVATSPSAPNAANAGTPVVSPPGAPIQTSSNSSPQTPTQPPSTEAPIRQTGGVAAAAAPFAPTPTSSPKSPGFHLPSSPLGRDGRVDQIPVGTPRQVQALWENRVVPTTNVNANGQTMPCLAGRVYLMGQEVGHSFRANGSCIVDAYEVFPDGKTKMIERWEFNNEMLSKLLFKDSIGWGYTLFLPWTTYRPNINRVQLQAKFIPETGGLPLFSPASTISLLQQAPPSIHSATITPTAK